MAMHARKGKAYRRGAISAGNRGDMGRKSRKNSTRSGQEESSTTIIKKPAMKRGLRYPH